VFYGDVIVFFSIQKSKKVIFGGIEKKIGFDFLFKMKKKEKS